MERRLRTYWLLRERYRRAANIATVLGALVGLGLVGAALRAAGEFGVSTMAAGGLLVLLAALLPRLIVRGIWRLQRGRLRERLG